MAAEPDSPLTPAPREAALLEIAVILFTVPVSVLGYLAFFLSRTCVYEEPYTLQGCITDLLWSNKWGVAKCFLWALLFYGVPMHFHFKWLADRWRFGYRALKRHLFSCALIMGGIGLFAMTLWPIGALVWYWLGGELKEIVHKKGDFIPLFQQAAENMATQPAIYAIAGLLGGGLHYLGLRLLEKRAPKKPAAP